MTSNFSVLSVVGFNWKLPCVALKCVLALFFYSEVWLIATSFHAKGLQKLVCNYIYICTAFGLQPVLIVAFRTDDIKEVQEDSFKIHVSLKEVRVFKR